MLYTPALLIVMNPERFRMLIEIGWSAIWLAELYMLDERTIRKYAKSVGLSCRKADTIERLHRVIQMYDGTWNKEMIPIYARCTLDFMEMYLSGKFQRRPHEAYHDLKLIRARGRRRVHRVPGTETNQARDTSVTTTESE